MPAFVPLREHRNFAINTIYPCEEIISETVAKAEEAMQMISNPVFFKVPLFLELDVDHAVQSLCTASVQ